MNFEQAKRKAIKEAEHMKLISTREGDHEWFFVFKAHPNKPGSDGDVLSVSKDNGSVRHVDIRTKDGFAAFLNAKISKDENITQM